MSEHGAWAFSKRPLRVLEGESDKMTNKQSEEDRKFSPGAMAG